MKTKADYFAALVIILLGILHTVLTPLLVKKFDIAPLDFAAIGLAFIFLGCINISRIRTADRLVCVLCLLANLLCIAWMILCFIHTHSFAQQGSVPFAAILFMTIQTLIQFRSLTSRTLQ